jgi:phage/plasmid-associated DNA primase
MNDSQNISNNKQNRLVTEFGLDLTASHPCILHGSDIEIARSLKIYLHRLFGSVISDGGTIYVFADKCWRPLDDHYLRSIVHGYDGMKYEDAKGKEKVIRLNKKSIDSIINELHTMLSPAVYSRQMYCNRTSFFDVAVPGINVQNGFLTFTDEGAVLYEHDPIMRQRHVLPVVYQDYSHYGASDFYLPGDSLLARLLYGSFGEDPNGEDKISLIQEIFGCAISRFSTKLKKAKFILFYGQSANNGKSQFLELLASLLPPDVVTSIPVEEWGDEKYRVSLRDSVLNIVAELSGSMIQSNIFKSIVTGDMISGRDVYKSAVYFRATALHVAATNKLPVFSGGVDRGVYSRLLPIEFTRSIPKEEQIENIAKKIIESELDLLFHWAVDGAKRLIQRGDYPDLPCVAETLDDWTRQADPVLDWIRDCCEVGSQYKNFISNDKILTEFMNWAASEHYQDRFLPQGREVIARIAALPGVQKVRTNRARGLTGINIHKTMVPKQW